MTAPGNSVPSLRQRNFVLIWLGQTTSLFGTQLTAVAVPITAVVVLKATAMETGILGALDTFPFLLFGMVAGVLLDRRKRRPILIWANIIQAVALSSVPIAYLMGKLTIVQLFLAVFAVGAMAVFFDLGYQAYLPSLVGREVLLKANARLQISESLADVASPGIAGALISALGGPFVIALDVISYVISSLTISALPSDAPPTRTEPLQQSIKPSAWASMREGLSVVRQNVILRWCTAAAVVTNLCVSALMAVFFLFLIRDAGMGPTQIGLIVSAGGLGAVAGGLALNRLTRLFGVGPMLIRAAAMPGFGYLILAAVHGRSAWAVAAAAIADFIGLFSLPVFNVTVITFRQMVTPDHLLGRVNATVRTCAWGGVSLGSLLGGVLGSTLGLRETILVGALGVFIVPILLFLSPIRSIREFDSAERIAATDLEPTTTQSSKS
jgi:MFS family permease